MSSKQLEDMLTQAQIYQQQMQGVMAQKTALMLELNEIKKALEEMEKSGEKTVFKIAGPILIRTGMESAAKELREKEEFDGVRLKSAEKQEERIKEKIEELREKLMAGK
jgi:prefoldin beta subunit